MPHLAIRSGNALQPTKWCWPIRLSLGIFFRNQALAVSALAKVSMVVNVLEAIINKVEP